jgi:cyclopropane-fatty-acyl-phospholipid synthase
MKLLNPIASSALFLIERGYVPEPIVRSMIRKLIGIRFEGLNQGSSEEQRTRSNKFLEHASEEVQLALDTDKANEQHYEVPAEFFELVLGPHKKYSSCFFGEGNEDLGQAEADALSITCQRAGIQNGMSILELGCGWGSLTLWMAEHYPDSAIVAVSNSTSQREFIVSEARRRGVDGKLQVLTCDINNLRLDQTFDRIVSIEMFEHVRNHRILLERISRWLTEDGQLFVHVFCHRQFAYPFETQGAANWMGRHFFSGGMMPSRDLFERYDEHLRVTSQWTWNGLHYQKTANAWARNLHRNRKSAMAIFRQTYGAGEELKWYMRWKVFFLACAELFGYRDGNEWHVQHYLFEQARAVKARAFERREECDQHAKA